MPRPQKPRKVHQPPIFTEFKPIGIGGRFLEELILTIDEYEAIRLADYLGYNHLNASKEMNISRSTFSRLVDKARNKIASFIIEGKELDIAGGSVRFSKDLFC